MINVFNTAIVIATTIHINDVDKVGKPYILHPMRVALAMTTDVERAVAMLHDVIEDHPALTTTLENMFPTEIVDAVKIVSRVEGETYAEFIMRIKNSNNPIAIAVKIADLKDNLNRIEELPPEMKTIEKRYRKALKELTT